MHRISEALGNDGEPAAGESERHSLGHATSEVRPRSRVHGLRFESGDIGGIDVCWFGGTILSGHGAAEGHVSVRSFLLARACSHRFAVLHLHILALCGSRRRVAKIRSLAHCMRVNQEAVCGRDFEDREWD
jgi:hypothetical protein